MKKTEQKDDAVSPVVGVMLMLVVTIIIAAVVAAFAGGVMTSQEPAPTAVLDVTFDSAYVFNGGSMGISTYPLFKVSYLSGTSDLDTGKMTISSSWKGDDGKLYSYVYSGNQTMTYKNKPLGVMYKATTSGLVTSDSSFWFNNCALSPGDVLVSASQYAYYAVSPVDKIMNIDEDSALEKIFGDHSEKIEKGTELTITISYGNYVIYDGKVIVE